MRRILAVAMTALGLALMSGVPAAQASTRIKIYEIYYNSPGPDYGSNWSLNHEWIELHNLTGHRINLTHWTIRDRAGHVYRFGVYHLKAHGYVKIHTGKGHDTRRNRHWGKSWYIWNNNGDRAALKNAHGRVIDRCSYSDPSESRSYVMC